MNLLSRTASRPQGVWAKMVHIILALVLVIGLVPTAPSTATAATGDTHSITYVVNGGELSSTAPSSYVEGTAAALPSADDSSGATITRDGYTFDGWYKTADFSGQQVSSAGQSGDTTDLTFYAKWTQDAQASALINVYVRSGNGAYSLAKSYTKDEFEALQSSGDPVSALYNKGGWHVSTAATYVTLDDLLADANVTWNQDATISYGGDATQGKSVNTFTYTDLQNMYFYPATTASAKDTTGAVKAPFVLSIAEASSAVTTTAADAEAANVANATSANEVRTVMGSLESNYTAGSGATVMGKRLWNNTDALYVTLNTEATAPTAVSDLVYNGSAQTGVAAGEGYTLSVAADSGAAIDENGNATAVNAGDYTVTATLNDGYIWSDGSTSAKTVTFSIGKLAANVTANSATAAVGADMPQFDLNSKATALAKGDSISGVTFTCAAADTSTAGSYEIVPVLDNAKVTNANGTDVTANYNLTPVSGTFTVTDKIMNVYVRSGESGEYALAKGYTKAEFEALQSSGDPVSALYYKGGWQVSTAVTYVTLDDLLADAGVEGWGTGATVSWGGDPAQGKATNSFSYDDIQNMMFYPATTASATDTTGAVSAPFVFSITERASAVSTTAADAQAYNVEHATATNEPRTVMGSLESDYTAGSGATIMGKRLWNNTDAIYVTVPARTDLSSASIAAIPDQVYGGQAVEPGVTVTLGDATLTEGTDYTVSYADNNALGTATVTVTGTGNYTGAVTATFEIVSPFTDVDATTSHGSDICWLAANGIAAGYDDGTFQGMTTVYRQDMAAFLYREAKMLGIGDAATWEPSESDFVFTDVTAATPHYKEILWLAHAGIAQGYSNGDGTYSFGVGTVVYRQDMAAFMHRLATLGGFADSVTPSTAFANDATVTSHADDVAWLAGAQITTGYDDGTFQGMWPTYRQDMAAFLHRFADLKA